MSPDGVEHAFTLFDRAAKGSGSLRLYARQEEALLKVRLGQEKDALIIYDDILRSIPTLRSGWSLCGKADCQIATEATASGTGACAAAIALYDQIVADPEVTTPWRDQALYKKGRCLDKQGLSAEALTAFYDILNAPDVRAALSLRISSGLRKRATMPRACSNRSPNGPAPSRSSKKWPKPEVPAPPKPANAPTSSGWNISSGTKRPTYNPEVRPSLRDRTARPRGPQPSASAAPAILPNLRRDALRRPRASKKRTTRAPSGPLR